MTQRLATTPFGGGRFTAADFQNEHWIERQRETLRMVGGAGFNDTAKTDKYELLRALTEAKVQFGIGDRAIRVLEALLSFHQSKEIAGEEPIVVFPSNRELALRTRGMAHVTLRRHIRALVEARLIVRRDSPNGKRYCVRDGHGDVEQVYGFDLSPFALMASRIYEAAEKARDHLRTVRRVRGEITVHLRDIARLIETAIDERRAGGWNNMAGRLSALSGRVGRFTPLNEHQARLVDLIDLRRDVENLYLASIPEEELNANDVQNDRHIQNSETELNFDVSNDKGEERGRRQDHTPTDEATTESTGPVSQGSHAENGRKERMVPVSLSLFKRACPDFLAYAREELRTWRDVVGVAELVRNMLGISPDAGRRAAAAMGLVPTAIVLACILQRHERINSPGGYLRALTKRAEEGRFSVRPMVDALLSG